MEPVLSVIFLYVVYIVQYSNNIRHHATMFIHLAKLIRYVSGQ